MRIALGFLSGLVFGLGLVISWMSNPAKVLNFFDVFGTWDPSLAFAMDGDTTLDVPTNTRIDRPLTTGAALFGIGWGFDGFCPGPAWTALPLLAPGTLVFLPAMLAGLWLGARAKTFNFLASKGTTQ